MDYKSFFRRVFGHEVENYPYQGRLAGESWPNLLSAPTGMGKTAAVTLAWLYKRGWRVGERATAPDPETPRRLVWCLPMRVLVEQTETVIRSWLAALDVQGEAGEKRVSVHVLMGGESDLKTWSEHPEEDMILIGTQDMLLSRALMRGYGMSRYQWPVQFALLHNDCLWVYDEVQLMGAGLPTSAQLEAFRRLFAPARSSHTLWMSATLNRDWLGTVDLKAHLDGLQTLGLEEADRERAGDRLQAEKRLQQATPKLDAAAGNKAGRLAYLDALHDALLQAHDPAGQTLVVLNRVDRAQELFQRLLKSRPESADLLIHARFRPKERGLIERQLKDVDLGRDRIIVSTQAIEAGVDISARVLFTELAPWPSLVQRFGRCNRYGEHNGNGGADIHWVDIADDAPADIRLPYDVETLSNARNKLAGLASANPNDLPKTDEARSLSPVIRRKDLLDLFNTDPDLSGFDVDVSDYIRDTDTPGLQVFWRDTTSPNKPVPQTQPQSAELCPVSISQAGAALKKRDAWRWNSLDGDWVKLERGAARPGMTLLLNASEGGYDNRLGFLASARQPVDSAYQPDSNASSLQAFDGNDRSYQQRPILLSDHLDHVTEQARLLCAALDESGLSSNIVRAAHWHDVGKAHPAFQALLLAGNPEAEAKRDRLWAKSVKFPHVDTNEAKAGATGQDPALRKHFRHELASALAWLARYDDPQKPDPDTDLIAYLIAAHHGKVRMSLRAMPTETAPPETERFARGIREGDRLPVPAIDGEDRKEIVISLALMELGDGVQGRSWTSRVLELLDTHGPFRLAWAETLVRIADWRASALEQQTDHEITERTDA